MSLNIFWFLPTHGDGHYLGTAEGARAVDHGYLQQVAQAADRLGFGGVLIPTGRSCEDSWVLASSLIDATRRLKFLIALRPGLVQPGRQPLRGQARQRRLGAGPCQSRTWFSAFPKPCLAGLVSAFSVEGGTAQLGDAGDLVDADSGLEHQR